MARLTLWGMQQYLPDLLSYVRLPSGMNAQNFTQMLNYQAGDLYPYCQVPNILQGLIGNWFAIRQADFQRMYEALTAEYSPIENYDRTEERTLNTTHSGSDTDTLTAGTQVKTTRTGTEETINTGTNTKTETGTEGLTTNVSAYDSSSMVPRESSTRTPNMTTTDKPDLTQIVTPDLTDTSVNSGTDTKKTDYGHVEDGQEHIRAHGNIGVTTNQQMIQAEMEMRIQWNLYQTIIDLFAKEFLSQIY